MCGRLAGWRIRFGFLALALILQACQIASAQAKRPNIVIFLSDDQGWGDLSINGNKNLSTPNIDSLARDGATLDRFFVCPLCAPTRAEFLTGRYHARGGVRGVSTGLERLNLDEKTIAQYFKEAGYTTGAFGKWHNGTQWPYHPLARGFDEYYGFTSGHWGEYFDPPLDHNGKLVRGKGYIADDFANHALEFIERNKERPFFCYIPFNTPHSPYAVPDEYWRRFKDKPIEMRGSLGDREALAETRCVLAMCENIDWNVGRVLKRLEELKLADDTIVIYFSDNGPDTLRWNGGMKGKKASTDEGGVRAPFFIRWPGKIPAGVKTAEIAGAIDLLPTLAKLAGIELKPVKLLDGIDISPTFMGSVRNWPDRMIFSHRGDRVSIRTRQYRFDDWGALFDMHADPGQTTNVASKHPDVMEKCNLAEIEWRRHVLRNKPAAREDDRPFTVGYREFPMTILPARDGVPSGGVERSAGAPNCSYFVNWTDGMMSWDIEVNTAGQYDATIYYTAREAGSLIELSFKGKKVTSRVEPAWDPPLYTNQDTIPRPRAESQMKEFRPLEMGIIELEKGRGPLELRARVRNGKTVMDVRQIVLTLREPK